MSAFANAFSGPQSDGMPYCTNKAVPAAENDLYNFQPSVPPGKDPVEVLYGEAIVAIVVLTAAGSIQSQTTFIVLQTDLGGGNWIDVAWITWTGTTGSATFVLSGGAHGANAFQQDRATGTAPNPTSGSRQFPLGGRIRFVGKSSINATAQASSSSSSSAGGPSISCTIRHKLLGLR